MTQITTLLKSEKESNNNMILLIKEKGNKVEIEYL